MTDTDLLPDVIEYLHHTAPFSGLPIEALKSIATQLSICYAAAHKPQQLLHEEALFWIRSGTAELRNADRQALDFLETGGCFGVLLAGTPSDARLEILDDLLLYRLDKNSIRKLTERYPTVAQFVQRRASRYLLHQKGGEKEHLLHTQVRQLMHRALVSVRPDATVQQAAQLMTRERVSSLAVVQAGRLQGILTDRDLRSRLLAQGLDGHTLVEAVMTHPVSTIRPEIEAMDALMQMAREHVHHLPVVEDQQLLGMLTATDLLNLQRATPLFLSDDLARQRDYQGLLATAERLPLMFRQLIDSNVRAERIGALLSTAADVITQRLLFFAEQRLGPPPMSYCWLVFGAHARQELTLASDQDNALLLAETPDAAAAEYFAELARYVCDGLNACGYRYCPGGIMATNPNWRRSLQQWQQQFRQWITEPTAEALLNAGIFFDIRAVGGESALADPLQHALLEQTRQHSIFISIMARGALQFRPPLGLFNRLVLDKDSDGNKGIDLKKRALAPLIELTRVNALANGIAAQSTLARLDAISNARLLSQEDCKNLAEAARWLMRLRYQLHQSQLEQQQPMHHRIDPLQLSSLQRHQLKEIFLLIDRAQQALILRYAGGRG